jgi:hypothetical protein
VDVPTPSANLNGIAAAPDGAIWFAETGAARVGRITDTGVEEFVVGPSPRGVVVQPDGDVWATVGGSGAVVRLRDVPPDTTAPTISIDSPAPGSWTVLDNDSLAADYSCADDTDPAPSCAGDVISGDPVPDDTVGVHTFSVHAEDAAGNAADASVEYLVFDEVDGSLLEDSPARAGHKLQLSLGMGLAKHGPRPEVTAVATPVVCDTGATTGPAVAANVKVKVHPHGSLELKWDTDRSWGGCWTLTLDLAQQGWDSAATFGPVAFEAAKPPKSPKR